MIWSSVLSRITGISFNQESLDSAAMFSELNTAKLANFSRGGKSPVNFDPDALSARDKKAYYGGA